MSSPFSRTLRSVETDDFRLVHVGLGLAALLAIAWCGWLFLARVTLYQVTLAARLEAEAQAQPLVAEVTGRVQDLLVAAGDTVARDQILVVLKAENQRFELDSEQSRGEALAARLVALSAELAAREQALAEERGATRAALAEAVARLDEARAGAVLAEEDAQRLERLQGEGHISEMELLQARTLALQRQAEAQAQAQVVARLQWQGQGEGNVGLADVEALRGELATLQGELASHGATLARRARDYDLRQVRAPVAGALAELVPLPIGTLVTAGSRLGAVVPAGDLRVVAWFEPGGALGRIRAGQVGRLRLDGFPWAQYGSLPVQVENVAGELRDGRLRVELSLGGVSSTIPMQHGLTGTVEVGVEQVSPAWLLLRSVGAFAGQSLPRGG